MLIKLKGKEGGPNFSNGYIFKQISILGWNSRFVLLFFRNIIIPNETFRFMYLYATISDTHEHTSHVRMRGHGPLKKKKKLFVILYQFYRY